MSPSAVKQRISLRDINHVYYKHKDLDKAHEFLVDFGFSEVKRVGDKIYYRGFGTRPFLYCAEKADDNAFGGTAFTVDSLEDLQLATEILPNVSEIYDLTDAPGGGKCVTFKDPVDGFPFHLVYGQTPVEPSQEFEQRVFNFPMVKPRGVGQSQRFSKGPAAIHKLGHFGVCHTNYNKAYEFYTTHFNFVATDFVHNDENVDIVVFMHLDRGDDLVDHHCFFFYEGPEPHVHHSSYEVHDFDRQVLGHDWLRDKGYDNCWGVGRHILGSQIFDYWFDPSRFILEHYVDGDLVNGKTVPSRSLANPNSLHIWGPDLPPDFLQ